MHFKLLATSVCAMALIATPVLAETDETLKKIADSGEINVGHRDGNVPFSYYDDQQRPIGYALDLCAIVVDAVKAKRAIFFVFARRHTVFGLKCMVLSGFY